MIVIPLWPLLRIVIKIPRLLVLRIWPAPWGGLVLKPSEGVIVEIVIIALTALIAPMGDGICEKFVSMAPTYSPKS